MNGRLYASRRKMSRLCADDAAPYVDWRWCMEINGSVYFVRELYTWRPGRKHAYYEIASDRRLYRVRASDRKRMDRYAYPLPDDPETARKYLQDRLYTPLLPRHLRVDKDL